MLLSVELGTQVLNLVEPYSRIYAHVVGSVESAQDEHHQIVEALAASDATLLRAVLETSIRVARDGLMAAAAQTDGEEPDALEILLNLGG